MTNNQDLLRFIEGIPKAELHIHLDSAPASLLLRIAKRNDVTLPFNSLEEFNTWFVLTDLDDFMRKFKTLTSVLLTERDYFDVVCEFGRICHAQNILRCEAMFTFAAAHEGRVELDVLLSGLAEGRRAVKENFNVDIYFLADIDRTINPDRSLKYIRDIIPRKDEVGILGVGFDCEETGYPIGPHKKAFELARDHGLKLSAHAGEEFSAGPEAVWEVIDNIQPDRIDHGNQAIRDDKLLRHLASSQLPLTLCPMSNVAIQVYSKVEDHPIIALQERGLLVTINSDDNTMLGSRNDLVFNYKCVAEAFDLGFEDIIGLTRNGFAASYASTEDLRRYNTSLDAWLLVNTG
jgi:adenosine deaminase